MLCLIQAVWSVRMNVCVCVCVRAYVCVCVCMFFVDTSLMCRVEGCAVI